MGQCWVGPLEKEATRTKVRGPSQGHTLLCQPHRKVPTPLSALPWLLPPPLSPALISSLRVRERAEEEVGVGMLGQVEGKGHEKETESKRPSSYLFKSQA